jgi:hypothetical protein
VGFLILGQLQMVLVGVNVWWVAMDEVALYNLYPSTVGNFIS